MKRKRFSEEQIIGVLKEVESRGLRSLQQLCCLNGPVADRDLARLNHPQKTWKSQLSCWAGQGLCQKKTAQKMQIVHGGHVPDYQFGIGRGITVTLGNRPGRVLELMRRARQGSDGTERSP